MTSKEIEITKKFKKLGLEWIPAVGDKFYYRGEVRTVSGVRYTTSSAHVTYDNISKIAKGKYLEWYECEYCVFFPDITRCFEELIKRNQFPQLSFFDVPHKVDGENFAYYSANDGFVDGKKETGVTPREVMYKLLIEVMEVKDGK